METYRRRGRPRIHNWTELFRATAGATSCEFTLLRTTRHLAQQVRNQAAARDLRVRIQETDDEVSVVFAVGGIA